MSDDSKKPDQVDRDPTINVYGGQVGAGINRGTQNNTFNQSSKSEEMGEQLKQLLSQLQQLAKETPQAQDVVKEAEKAVSEANSENPQPARIQIRAEDLQKAADNIRLILPGVFAIATSIIGYLRQF